MFKIVSKRQLSADVYAMEIAAPLIARERHPGQFIILQVDEAFGERIPLTIADADADKGLVTIVFQAVGASTKRLAQMGVGDALPVFLGPLGKPTHVAKVGTVVCVGGGIGVAPMHPIAQAMKAAGNRVIVIMGARNKELLIMQEEMAKIADELIICTDDGSVGRKDLVTAPLKEICERPDRPDQVVMIGPPIMMKFCAETTRPYGVPSVASLNSIMIDGTGMCGGCRVLIGGKIKFVCVDGPEFDAHQVDFDNLMQRNRSYVKSEATAKAHVCNLDKMADACLNKK